MGAIVSRISGAPFVPAGFAEFAAACAIASTVTMALTDSPSGGTWQELAASCAIASTVVANLTDWRELATAADITSGVTLAASKGAELAASADIASTVVANLTDWRELAAAADITSGVTLALTRFTGDVRNIGLGAKLLAYWESRPAYASDAAASLTLAPTLLAKGTTPPVATLSGTRNPPQQVWMNYPTGGTVDGGVATFQCDMGDGRTNGPTGFVTSTPQSLGGGLFVSWAAGTVNTDNRHYAVLTSWAELTGRANCTLDDSLATGPIYEAYGLSSKEPSLLSAQPLDTAACLLANTNGVPALATGTDTPIEVHLVFESVFINDGNTAPRLFSFNGTASTDTSKSLLDMYLGGNGLTGLVNLYGLDRRDSATVPVTASVNSLTANKVDNSPHVACADYINGQLYIDGVPVCTATSLNRGVATTLGRFTLFGRKLGTSAASDFIRARISAVVITSATTAAEKLAIAKALAGVGLP